MGKRGTKRGHTLPLVEITVSNVLLLLHILYYFSYFKLKETLQLKKMLKLIQAFTKLNYDNEKVWRLYTFRDHPHYFLMSQNEHPLVGGNIKCSY